MFLNIFFNFVDKKEKKEYTFVETNFNINYKRIFAFVKKNSIYNYLQEGGIRNEQAVNVYAVHEPNLRV